MLYGCQIFSSQDMSQILLRRKKQQFNTLPLMKWWQISSLNQWLVTSLEKTRERSTIIHPSSETAGVCWRIVVLKLKYKYVSTEKGMGQQKCGWGSFISTRINIWSRNIKSLSLFKCWHECSWLFLRVLAQLRYHIYFILTLFRHLTSTTDQNSIFDSLVKIFNFWVFN